MAPKGKGKGKVSASSSGLEDEGGWKGVRLELGEMVRGLVQSLGKSSSSEAKRDPWISQFRKLGAPNFDGKGKPEDAESWLSEVEKILESLECPEEKWVRLATFQFKGEASQWWKSAHRLKFPDTDLLAIPWEEFREVFYERYFPEYERDRLDRDFQNLKQGSMSVAEYEAAFTWLEQFAQVFDSERCRAKKFVEGLVPALRSRVLGFRCPTLADAVELAARYEDDRKLFLEEHPKGKGVGKYSKIYIVF